MMTLPKLSNPGLAENCGGGLVAEPSTELVELPPLLANVTTLLKLPGTTGEKLTATNPVCPGLRLKGLPAATWKGGLDVAEPARGRPPMFATWKFWVMDWPVTKVPKFRLLGVMAKIGGILVVMM